MSDHAYTLLSVRGRKLDCDSSDGPMHRAQKQKLEVGEID
jgi:hypothetical protein